MEDAFAGTERFRVVRRIGAGGMGVVYEALDLERNVHVALKTLRGLGGNDIFQFKREFRALADVQHPNLISLGELYEHEGQFFFSMELVRGMEILAYVREPALRLAPARAITGVDRAEAVGVRAAVAAVETIAASELPPPVIGRGPDTSGVRARASSRPGPASSRPAHPARSLLPPPVFHPVDDERVRATIAQLASALAAIHAADKVHRDVKPSNILVTEQGRVVLLDFGLVADARRELEGAPFETRFAGTLPYMAPESLLRVVGPEGDWYAVGVLLFEMLTSRLPFEGSSVAAMWRKQVESPPSPSDLATDVPEDLERLCLDLLAVDPAKRPRVLEILERLGARRGSTQVSTRPTSEPVFVGRRREIDELERAFEAASAKTVTVLVRGESGIGKTALVLAGRCHEREAVPYKGVDGVVDALCQHLARLPEGELALLVPEGAALLPRMFPVLKKIEALGTSQWEGEEPWASLEPHVVRARTFEALRELFARLAAKQRLVLLIDDLQWADADSVALLAAILSPPTTPLLLVATLRARDVELPGDVRELRLGLLERDDALELAKQLVERAGGLATPDSVVDGASGHPMFMDELARHARRVHPVPTPSSDVDERSPASGVAVRLDDALRARVSLLPPDARRLLELVSLAGAPLSERVVAGAALSDPSDYHRCLALLRGANFVRTSGVRGEGAVETNHDRIRAAVLAGLDDEARAKHAGRLARSLEASGRDDAEALASWYRLAGDRVRAAGYAELAAERAATALAFDRAVTLFRTALELAKPEHRRRLHASLADALTNAGRGGEAADAYLAAAAIARGEAAHVLRRRAAEELLRSGHIDAGLDVLVGVLSDVGMRLPRTPAGALASALYHRARLAVRGHRHGVSFAPPGRSATARDPALLRRADAAWSVAVGLSLVDVVRAADFQARAMHLALQAGEPRRLVCSFAMAASFAASEAGTRASAPSQLAAARALTRHTEDPYAHAWIPLSAAMLALVAGSFRQALEEADDAYKRFQDHCKGVSWELTSARSIAFWALGYMGDIPELARRVDELLRETRGRDDRYATINVSTGAAHLARLAADDPAASRDESARAIAAWSHRGFTMQHLFDLFTQSETLLYEERPEVGLRRLESRSRDLEKSLLLRLQTARIFITDLHGRLELATAARAGGALAGRLLASCESRAQLLEAQGLAWATALAAALRAGMALQTGDRVRARTGYERAAHALAEAQMALHAAAAERACGLVAGDATRVAAAEASMRGRGIENVDRWSRMLVPMPVR